MPAIASEQPPATPTRVEVTEERARRWRPRIAEHRPRPPVTLARSPTQGMSELLSRRAAGRARIRVLPGTPPREQPRPGTTTMGYMSASLASPTDTCLLWPARWPIEEG